ncbi:hypothetical protein GCM10009663_17290 [Kitasatospora arboriphila]|uniref:Uncharacterized protein n=1 Tax=Kitasatospora arboriphila TaxID=258052 RepID=A0ABP4E034_9ACTN
MAAGVLAAATVAGQAHAAPAPRLALTSVAFAQSTVDATSGEATAMLEWTLTDGNVAATDVTGDVVVQQVGADGRGIGPEHHVTFRHQPDSWFKANAVSGTPQSAVYRYDFPVPRYAATPTATWAVVKVTAKDDQGTALTVGRSRLNGPHTSVTATELVDGTGPGYESFYLKSQSRFRYLDGNPVAYQYSFTALDEESGFHRARLTVGGPGGATVTGDVETNTLSWGLIECGPDGFETSPGAVYCNLPVTFPADTPEGTWTPSRLRLADNAGNTAVAKDLPAAAAVHLTRNSVLSAAGFSIPATFDTSAGGVSVPLTLKPEGVQGGIASVTVETADPYACSATTVDAPAVASDGTVTVPVWAPGLNDHCTVTGIALLDGAGHAAAYGSAFGGPALALESHRVTAPTP